RFPWLNIDGLAGGALGLSGEGWFDPWSLLTLFRKGAGARGVHFLDAEVIGLERQGTAVRSVALADGSRIACGSLVNAAGPAAGQIADMLGILLPVEPRKRFVFVIDCRTSLPPCPL